MKLTLALLPLFYLISLIGCKEQPPTMAGDYTVTQNGVTTTASLTVEDTRLSGLINIGGSAGIVSGTVTGTTATGTMAVTDENKNYPFTGILTGDTLKLIIRFAELENTEVVFNLNRVVPGESPTPAPGTAMEKNPDDTPPAGSASIEQKEMTPPGSDASETERPVTTTTLDSRLIGTWKNTEVISSGSGDSYGSFSSESFIQFTEAGVVYMWAGQSAGGGGGQSFESTGHSRKEEGKWRTEGKFIVFIDPSTGQEGKTQFMVDAGRMLLSDGGSNKKIFIRVE